MRKLFTYLALIIFLPLASFAQDKSEKVKIRIETKDKNGQTKVVEKEYDTAGMNEQQREELLDNIQDSMMNDLGKSKGMKVIIKDFNTDDDFDFDFEDRFSFDDDFEMNDSDVKVYHHKKYKKGADFDGFEYEMERLGDQLRVLGEDMPRKLSKAIPKIYTWNDGIFIAEGNASIQSLDVFANRPVTDDVNVRFYAPKEGDVTITIINTTGEVVGQEAIQNFSGEYAGQVKLKEKPAGTYFVIVSQGDDGVSRKVTFDH